MIVPALLVSLTLVPGSMPARTVPVARPDVRHADAPDPGNTTYGASDRLRPQGRRVARWLQEARRRSPTVRRLAARIAASDVIVYLDINRRLAPDVAACLTWMAATPARRIVRVSVRMDLTANDAVAMIAHELQHVVEVIEHPDVRSNDGLRALYQRIGHTTGTNGLQWDTADAIAVGTLARLEAMSGSTAPGAPGPSTEGT